MATLTEARYRIIGAGKNIGIVSNYFIKQINKDRYIIENFYSNDRKVLLECIVLDENYKIKKKEEMIWKWENGSVVIDRTEKIREILEMNSMNYLKTIECCFYLLLEENPAIRAMSNILDDERANKLLICYDKNKTKFGITITRLKEYLEWVGIKATEDEIIQKTIEKAENLIIAKPTASTYYAILPRRTIILYNTDHIKDYREFIKDAKIIESKVLYKTIYFVFFNSNSNTYEDILYNAQKIAKKIQQSLNFF